MLLAGFFVTDRDAAAAGWALKQFLVLKKIYAERAQVLKTNAWKEFWGEFAPRLHFMKVNFRTEMNPRFNGEAMQVTSLKQVPCTYTDLRALDELKWRLEPKKIV